MGQFQSQQGVLQRALVLGAAAFLAVGCSTAQLNTKADYAPAAEALRAHGPDAALAAFPTHESNGWITSLEKAYLSWLSEKPTPMPLLRHADDLARREMIFVSDELGYFFFQESEEGYIPAEHEVVWLHLVTGFSFAQTGDLEKARVEALRASLALQNRKSGAFDDPGLRLISGALWLVVGEWEHARVDFRRAFELKMDWTWLKAMAESDRPPENFVLVFDGQGPQIFGAPGKEVWFTLEPATGKVELTDASARHSFSPRALHSSESWYARHLQRNHAIRAELAQSRYMLQATGVSARTGFGLALTKAVASTVALGGIALGAGIVGGSLYLAAKASQGGGDVSQALAPIIGLGVGVAYGAVKGAEKFDRSMTRDLQAQWREDLDRSHQYRFVRFLPSRIWADAPESRSELFLKADIGGALKRPVSSLRSPDGRTRIQIFFRPETSAAP